MWSSVGPAAAERDVDSKTELARFLRREPQRVYEAVGKIRKITQTVFGIIQRDRVNGLYLDAADPAVLHGAQLALQFGLGNSGSEPPPSHQDARVVRRILKSALERLYARLP
jgi:hypothetical protein